MATSRPTHTRTQIPKNPTLVVATPKRLGALPVVITINHLALKELRILFDLRCIIQFTRFLGTLKQKLFYLRRGNQLYTISGQAQAKVILFTTRKSVIHDFRVNSSEISVMHDFQVSSSENYSVYDMEVSYT